MKIFYYDGTLEGFLTTLYHFAFTFKDVVLKEIQIINSRIFPKKEPSLFSEEILTDFKIALELKNYLRNSLSKEFYQKIYLYYLCDTAQLEIPLIEILRKLNYYNKNYKNITDENINKLYKAERSFYREKHRFLGLLRFIELPDKTLFAKFEPKFNLLPKIWNHFVNRFPKENLVIFDSLRKLIFIYKERRKRLFWIEGLEIEISPHLDPFIEFWQIYFKNIAIPQRISYKRQRTRLPLKIRKFLPEFWNW